MTTLPSPHLMLRGFRNALASRAAVDAAGVRALGARAQAADRVAVIVGSSVAGPALAAHLGRAARSTPGLRVVLVVGRPPVRKRLVQGCSLRRGALMCLARALGCERDALIARLGGRAASFHRG